MVEESTALVGCIFGEYTVIFYHTSCNIHFPLQEISVVPNIPLHIHSGNKMPPSTSILGPNHMNNNNM